MSIKLGDVFPDFSVETDQGPIEYHKFLGNAWGILFSHPADFTPVCTTELARAAVLAPEFAKRNVKMIALSIDDAETHRAWINDITAYGKVNGKWPYPIIADTDRSLATKLGMLDPDERDAKGLPLTARAVFIIGPDKRMKLSLLYPATTGRSFDEIIRVIDSLQLTATKKVATPVDWQSGGDCMVVPSVKEDEVAGLFPKGVKTVPLPSGKGYVRVTPQP